VRDETTEILGHLEEIVFQEAFQTNTFFPKLQGFFQVKGPCIVTAGMLKLPKNSLRVINPNQYICTLVTSDEFFCEVDIELGKGYRMMEEYENLRPYQPFSPSKPVSLFLDSSFTPIKAVFYSVQIFPNVDGSLKESLLLTITTKGNKAPSRCMYEGFKFLIDLFYPFLDFSSNLVKSSDFAKMIESEKKETSILFSSRQTEEKLEEREKKRKENFQNFHDSILSDSMEETVEKDSGLEKTNEAESKNQE
jgi:DNA-directed RNA polymerase alpha subunit